MLTHAAFTVDHDARTITMTRRIPAPPERLFEAWTTPAQVAQWWDPEGRPLADCRIDLRVGGALRFQNQGAAHAFEGVWQVIDPPHRLAFDAMGARGELSFQPSSEGTVMSLVMTCASAEHLEQFLRMGIAEGTSRTLANLAAFLAPPG